MKNLLCRLFGHRPAFGYGNSKSEGYFNVEVRGTDGLGRTHAVLYCDCERCGVNYHVGNIHLPKFNAGLGAWE